MIRRILIPLAYTLAFAMLLAVMGWAFVSGRNADGAIVCRGISVDVREHRHENFVSADEISAAVTQKFGDQRGRRIGDIDLESIESFVDSRSAVLKSEAYTGRDSVLHISVTQRRPVLRLQCGERGCYCDERGKLFPLHGKTAARVPVVDGNLPVDIQTNGKPSTDRGAAWIDKMVNLAEFVDRSVWKGRINQFRVDSRGDLTVYLKDCRERFILGTPDDIEAKFDRIEAYFTCVKPSLPEGKTYSSVNVKFERQLVCR